MDARPVVDLALPVGAFPVGAVEPHLADRPVAGEQLAELRRIDVVVARRVAVGGLMPVPRAQVEAGAEPLSAAGIHELAHHVARAVAPWRGAHGVVGRPCGPEAEAVVVLGGQHHRPGAGGAGGAGPGARIERGGREEGRALSPVTPFAAGEGVDGEVHEDGDLFALPAELGEGRYGPGTPVGADGPAERSGRGGEARADQRPAMHAPLRPASTCRAPPQARTGRARAAGR